MFWRSSEINPNNHLIQYEKINDLNVTKLLNIGVRKCRIKIKVNVYQKGKKFLHQF